ncbi:VOC family protein [Streptomyces sp. XM83C]|jgi:hypothetical protein|uniref:VOC family protein n=1 Tax=unclassified Streptomyces TaxID=2593676 RepID=UPI001FFB2D5E|nr:VOC family protein [Streptomyces sp. XM83C]MCK1819709.1 VOC family protein [Streptomyces sp. XM83C]
MPLVTAGVVVLDCAEPERLARFCKEFLEAEETEESANRVELRTGDGIRLAPRRDTDATPPGRPRPENSLQAHLDFAWRTWTRPNAASVSLGGRPTEAEDAPGPSEERAFADPTGHSFTLRRIPPPAPKRG